MKELAIIDLGQCSQNPGTEWEQIGRNLCQAATQHGFFYVSNHGISSQLIETAFNLTEKFFALPLEKKNLVGMTQGHRGFLQIGTSVMEGYSAADQKESFIWGPEYSNNSQPNQSETELLAKNKWPACLPEMQSPLNQLFRTVHTCTDKILRAMATGLGVNADYFTRHFRNPTSRGSLIHYPATTEQQEQYGVSPHTDFGCLSLLFQREPGLHVQTKQGKWEMVDILPDTIVVNIGDLMERWSNGKFRSVPHYVKNLKPQDRHSIVFFVDPASNTVIEPVVSDGDKRRFEPIGCAEYITGRFDKSFTYRN